MKASLTLAALLSATSLQALELQSLTVMGPGFTHHGYIHPEVKPSVKYKLGSDGTFAGHPIEIGLLARTEKFSFGALALSDCFGNPAGTVFGGREWDFFSDYTSVGLVGGVYVREGLEKSSVPIGFKSGGVEVMPLVGGSMSGRAPITKKLSLEINIIATYVINHGNVGLRWDF